MVSMIDRRLTVAAVFVALPALGGCISSTTYGTGQAPELAVFSEMTGGLAGGNRNKEPINYQPRAPLVMPPNGQLRQPIDTASVQGGPWPTATADPTADANTGPDDEVARDDITPEYERRLRPLIGLLPTPSDDGSTGNDSQDRVNNKYQTIVNPDERRQFSADLADAKGLTTAKRRYLTDPPDGYRTPAETAPTEFDEIDKTGKKKKNFFARLWPF